MSIYPDGIQIQVRNLSDEELEELIAARARPDRSLKHLAPEHLHLDAEATRKLADELFAHKHTLLPPSTSYDLNQAAKQVRTGWTLVVVANEGERKLLHGALNDGAYLITTVADVERGMSYLPSKVVVSGTVPGASLLQANLDRRVSVLAEEIQRVMQGELDAEDWYRKGQQPKDDGSRFGMFAQE